MTGDPIVQDQVIATIISPDLNNRLAQERTVLQRLSLDFERQEIETRSTLLNIRQTLEAAAVDVELARNHVDEAHVGQHYALWMEDKAPGSWRNYFMPTNSDDLPEPEGFPLPVSAFQRKPRPRSDCEPLNFINSSNRKSQRDYLLCKVTLMSIAKSEAH